MAIRVAIDYRPALRRPTGVGLYVHWLVDAALRVCPEVEWFVFASSWSDRLQLPWRDARVHPIDRRWPVRLLNYVWPRLRWPTIETLIGTSVDVVHCPYPMLIPSRTSRQVVTVHDLWFLRPDAGVEAEMGRDYPRFFYRVGRMAAAIVVPSQAVRRALMSVFPNADSRIHVIPHGLPPEFERPPAPSAVEAVRRRYGLPSHYILYVGALHRRKNPARALQVVAELHRRGFPHGLVIAGDGPLRTALQREQERHRLPVWFLGYVNRSTLPGLYGGADLFLMPSLDEGFGLPLLEAMAIGVPIVALARGAVAEVVGEAGVLVDEEEALTDACVRVLEDSSLRDRLVATGMARAQRFRWEETARRTAVVYQSLMEVGG